jgi:hypothetical protein
LPSRVAISSSAMDAVGSNLLYKLQRSHRCKLHRNHGNSASWHPLHRRQRGIFPTRSFEKRSQSVKSEHCGAVTCPTRSSAPAAQDHSGSHLLVSALVAMYLGETEKRLLSARGFNLVGGQALVLSARGFKRVGRRSECAIGTVRRCVSRGTGG